MKKALVLALALVMVLSVTAGIAEQYTLKVGHAQGEAHVRHLSLLAFEKMVEEKTNGGIQVELFPNGALGTEKEMLEMVTLGTLEGMRGGQLDFLPELYIFTLPFLVENQEQASALLSSDIARKITETSVKDNMLILGLGNAGGFRHFSNNARLIKTPADMVGLKMRTPTGYDTINRTFKALGASTVAIPYAELYMALKTGVVDGQENPATNVESMKFYEVQKYFTMVGYQFHPDPFYVNLDWFNSLPEDFQQIVRESAVEMMLVNDQSIAAAEAKALEVIKANAEVYYPTAEELQAFKDAVQGIYAEYVTEGKVTQENLDTMREIIKGAGN
jgi:TRAP-type transport system periplasmic protein